METKRTVYLDTFIDLLLRNQGKVMGYCYKHLRDWALAEDATQEVFLRAWRSWPTVRNKEHANTWLWRITARVVIDYSNSQYKFIHNNDLNNKDLSDHDDTERVEIRLILSELPPDFEEVIALFYIDGYSYEEIAAILSLPVSTVRGRLYQARKYLKKLMVPKESSGEKVIYEILAHLWQLTDDTDAKVDNWQLKNNKLVFSRGSGSFGNALSKKKDWTDYIVEAKFQIQTVGTKASALRIFWRNEQLWHGYGLSLCVDRSFIHRFAGDWRKAYFLGESEKTFELYKVHQIKIVTARNQFEVYLDGCKILDVQDPDNIYQAGGIGIRTDDLSVAIENVKVTLL